MKIPRHAEEAQDNELNTLFAGNHYEIEARSSENFHLNLNYIRHKIFEGQKLN